MSPVIIDDVHEKNIFQSTDAKTLEIYEFDNQGYMLLDEVHSSFGADDIAIKYTLLANHEHGIVIIDKVNDDNSFSSIGNIRFNILGLQYCKALAGGAQVKSAYIQADYRGHNLGVTSYELILRHFNVVSDTVQTIEGATFWKFKMAGHPDVEVIIVNDFSDYGNIVSDEAGDAEVYETSKTHLENRIWGVEGYVSETVGEYISFSYVPGKDDVVLVATKKYTPHNI